MIDVAPLSEVVRSHILKALVHKAKALQEIIFTSTARKNICECIIRMLTHQTIGASLSWSFVLDAEKVVAQVDKYEDMSSFQEEDGDADMNEVAYNSDSATLSLWFSFMFCWFYVLILDWFILVFDDVVIFMDFFLFDLLRQIEA